MVRNNRRLGVALAFVALGLGLSACQTSADSQASDNALYSDDTETPDPGLAKSLMQLIGAIPAERKPIKYDPRQPLVIPKDLADLPKPVSPRAFENTAGWPVDYDVQQARIARARAATADENGDYKVSPEEIAAILQVQKAGQGVSEQRIQEIAQAQKLTPEQQYALFKAAKAHEFYDMQGNPIRYTLQNPPSSYLAPAAGAPVTTEEPDYIKAAKRKNSWFGNLFGH